MNRLVQVSSMPAQLEVPQSVAYSPDDVMSASAVAAWLRPDLSPEAGRRWVAEKTRFRCISALPCRNIGRCLLFSRIEITNWIQSLERRPRAYPRRTKAQMAARAASARAAKASRKAAA